MFENVGLDYVFPLFIKEKDNSQNCYILLFTCAVTRAIHLELCADVSTTVLILTISRFSSRRGLPKLFVRGNFKSFKSIELKNFLPKGGIKWQFILEKSPWNYEEVLTPYHRIFGRNSDDNCTADFYEMISNNVRANFRCKGSYCLYLKGVSKQSSLQHYEKNIFITNHTFCKIIALFSATLS